MKKKRLQELLDIEADRWSRKSYVLLVRELEDVVSYGRGEGDDFHQFEVQRIESDPEFVHVLLSIDDGSFRKSFSPQTSGFFVFRDGRVER